jgi:hypothetical protein
MTNSRRRHARHPTGHAPLSLPSCLVFLFWCVEGVNAQGNLITIGKHGYEKALAWIAVVALVAFAGMCVCECVCVWVGGWVGGCKSVYGCGAYMHGRSLSSLYVYLLVSVFLCVAFMAKNVLTFHKPTHTHTQACSLASRLG